MRLWFWPVLTPRVSCLVSRVSVHAQAHVEAAEALSAKSKLAGQAYFVTNHEPVRFWGMMGDVLEGLGYARPSKHLPYLLIFVVALIFEYVVRPLLRPFKQVGVRACMENGRVGRYGEGGVC